jgi:hypothetical protein
LYNTCLASTRPWIQSPILQDNKNIRGEGRERRKKKKGKKEKKKKEKKKIVSFWI